MKLNNKGMTLIELLITIVFAGIILVFIFSMLNGLRNETDNNNFAYNNQINKVDLVHTIQKDLNNYLLVGIEDNSSDNLIINFHFLKGDDNKEVTAVLSSLYNEASKKYYLEYKNAQEEIHKFEMKGAEVDNCGSFTIYKENNNNELDNYYFKLNIYLYNKDYHEQNNKNKNNAVDDIEITYSGYKDSLINNSRYLTNKANETYNVGKC